MVFFWYVVGIYNYLVNECLVMCKIYNIVKYYGGVSLYIGLLNFRILGSENYYWSFKMNNQGKIKYFLWKWIFNLKNRKRLRGSIICNYK